MVKLSIFSHEMQSALKTAERYNNIFSAGLQQNSEKIVCVLLKSA